jgi:hypothetical protein
LARGRCVYDGSEVIEVVHVRVRFECCACLAVGRCYPSNRVVNEILRVLTLYSYHWILSYIVWGALVKQAVSFCTKPSPVLPFFISLSHMCTPMPQRGHFDDSFCIPPQRRPRQNPIRQIPADLIPSANLSHVIDKMVRIEQANRLDSLSPSLTPLIHTHAVFPNRPEKTTLGQEHGLGQVAIDLTFRRCVTVY